MNQQHEPQLDMNSIIYSLINQFRSIYNNNLLLKREEIILMYQIISNENYVHIFHQKLFLKLYLKSITVKLIVSV